MHCDRPLRSGKETQRISEGYGDNRRTWIECLVCVSKCHEPSKSFLSIAVLLFLSFMWFTGPARSYSDPIGLIPIGLMVAIIIRRFWDSHRYKPIYDRWVKKHGSNSEVWPKNKFKFDLWPNHVYHDPEATEKIQNGWVAEWSNAPVLKTGVRLRVPWVRIPPHPLFVSLLESRSSPELPCTAPVLNASFGMPS